jgi:predicted O-methyltransferase YrrM
LDQDAKNGRLGEDAMPEENLNSNQEELWTQVDSYLNATLVPRDPMLEAALAHNAEGGLPSIDVSPTQGKFLHMLARMHGAKRILEIGTLGGYSTIWLARALPADGRLITLEFAPKHAAVAGANVERAGLSGIVQIRVGKAADSLAQLHAEGTQPFDLIFIDADKPSNPVYLDWAMKLARKRTLLIVDNVIRDGEIANAQSTDPSVVGTRAMFEQMTTLQDAGLLQVTALQTVGSKGYDGFAFALVL